MFMDFKVGDYNPEDLSWKNSQKKPGSRMTQSGTNGAKPIRNFIMKQIDQKRGKESTFDLSLTEKTEKNTATQGILTGRSLN